jgi:hypothetical protein
VSGCTLTTLTIHLALLDLITSASNLPKQVNLIRCP